MIATVWNTTQSAQYEAERCCDEHDEHTEENRADDHRKCSSKVTRKGIFDDGDTLLMFALLMILMRESSDQKLIFSLLIAMLM